MPTDRKQEYCMMTDVLKFWKPALGQTLCCGQNVMRQNSSKYPRDTYCDPEGERQDETDG